LAEFSAMFENVNQYCSEEKTSSTI